MISFVAVDSVAVGAGDVADRVACASETGSTGRRGQELTVRVGDAV